MGESDMERLIDELESVLKKYNASIASERDDGYHKIEVSISLGGGIYTCKMLDQLGN